MKKEEPKYKEEQCMSCEGSGFVSRLNPAWLKQIRENERVSLREAAKELGVSAAYLSDIELGKRKGNLNIIRYYENKCNI